MTIGTKTSPVRTPRVAHPREVTAFFILLTVLFGVGVRVFPLLRADFPLVDGGLFYNMIRDLQANHYLLPTYTTYNLLHIPYAYPPLAFYLTGLINTLTHVPLLELIQWQPLVVNLLVLPVIFLCAQRLLRSSPSAALVTFLFAMTPNTYWWQILGGGLTRTLGALFGFLTAYCALRMFQEKRTVWLIGTIIAGALVVLSHPEWALQAILAAALFGLRWGRNRAGLRNGMIALVSVAALTAPWWLTVILRHGPAVFLYASQSTDSHLFFWMPLLTLSFTAEYVAFLAVFAVIGIFTAMARREYFLPAWVLIALFVDPRGGIAFALLPLSMLAAGVITETIAPYLLQVRGREPGEWWRALDLPVGKAFFGFVAIFCLSNAYNVSNTVSYHWLDSQERQALAWIAAQTDPKANLLVLSGEANPLHSPLLEWFPALTSRHNLTTVQGTEWLPGGQHYQAQIKYYSQAYACFNADVKCLSALGDEGGVAINYVVLSQEYGSPPEVTPLYRSLSDSPDFKLVFTTTEVSIFEHLP